MTLPLLEKLLTPLWRLKDQFCANQQKLVIVGVQGDALQRCVSAIQKQHEAIDVLLFQ